MASSDDLHARGLDLLIRGDTAGGISDLKTYLSTEPEDEQAWLELGTAYAAIAHWPDAARALARAVELDGSVPDARLAYARALVRLGKPDDAAFQLLQAAKVDPTDARVMKDLGVVFYDKRLYDKAVLWLGKAAAASPADARAHYALGLAHEGRKDIAAAVAAYREAIRCDPKLSDARKTLADALASIGELEGAVAALEDLLAYERSNEQAAHNRDVLARALADMHAHRLIGKTERELEASALFQEGQFRLRGSSSGEGAEVVRFGAPMTEVWVSLNGERRIESLMLVFTDPERAAKTEDDVFKVTVIAKDGKSEIVDYATALSLTFLREALGCPMTHVTELYSRLIGGEKWVDWGPMTVEFTSAPRPDKPSETRHGILVRGKE